MSRRHFPDNKIWANSPSEITDPTSALWANAYESGEGKAPPEAGVHNYIFNRSDEQHQHIEQNGIPRWLTDTEYADGGLALGSDGVIYQSQGAANQGNDPTTDDGTNWLPLPSVNLHYDNSGSTLTSENPQDAIDELDAKIESFSPGTVIDTQTFASPGSFTWNKPSGANADDTVVARIWAGGGSGASAENQTENLHGGGGGAYIEVSFRASALGSSEPVTVGGGANGVLSTSTSSNPGNAGDDSSFGGFTAKGGRRGDHNDGSNPPETPLPSGFVPPAGVEITFLPYRSGQAGDTAEGVFNGEDVLYAGGGGGSTDGSTSGSGGTSWKGGNGGAADIDSSNAVGGNGQAPGGGGGAAIVPGDGADATSGDGGDGQVIVYVIRGWSPSGITADIT